MPPHTNAAVRAAALSTQCLLGPDCTAIVLQCLKQPCKQEVSGHMLNHMQEPMQLRAGKVQHHLSVKLYIA